MEQKKIGSKKFWVKKNLRLKKILGHKNFRGRKKFAVKKIFGSQKFSGSKKFRSKRIGSEFFLSKETQVGLTQGGGCMTPPPENSRVKIVLGCC